MGQRPIKELRPKRASKPNPRYQGPDWVGQTSATSAITDFLLSREHVTARHIKLSYTLRLRLGFGDAEAIGRHLPTMDGSASESGVLGVYDGLEESNSITTGAERSWNRDPHGGNLDRTDRGTAIKAEGGRVADLIKIYDKHHIIYDPGVDLCSVRAQAMSSTDSGGEKGGFR
jgi:hypothetical protein